MDALTHASQGLDLHSASVPKVGPGSSQRLESKELADDEDSNISASEERPKKKRGKPTKASTVEKDSDSLDSMPNKGKKNQRKNKDSSSFVSSDAKVGSTKSSDKAKENNSNAPSEEWMMQRVLNLAPELEEVGG